MKITAAFIAALVAGFVISACTGDSDAGGNVATTGPTDSEFAALESKVDSLEQQVADLTAALETLSAAVPVVTARPEATGYAAKSSGLTGVSQLATSVPLGCKFNGYDPAEQRLGDTVQCISDAGVQFELTLDGEHVGVTTYYLTTDCSGTGYGSIAGFGAITQQVGAVIRSGSDILWLAADTPKTTGQTNSYRDAGGTCHAVTFTFSTPQLMELLPNDPTKTLVDNDYPPIDIG